jgi:uncharacterized protein (TIGR00725 family)
MIKRENRRSNADNLTTDHGTAAVTAGKASPKHRERPVITVFGSSQARRGGKLYAASYAMGHLLGAAGFDVMTGGYQGAMEAASRGAHAAGARVIGVTMARFRDSVNPFVMEEVRTANFYERFGWLVDRADGYIAMHGGIGTLAEVSFAWQEILLGMVSTRPLILVGERWQRLFKSFRTNLIPTPGIFAPVTVVATPAKAVKLLTAHFGPSAPAALERVND